MEIHMRRTLPLLAFLAFACADSTTPTAPATSTASFSSGSGSEYGDRDGERRGDRKRDFTIYAVDDQNFLVKFDSDSPDEARRTPIVGTDGNVVGIDFRPNDQTADGIDNTGKLYGVTRGSRIYIINPDNGVATLQSQMTIPLVGNFFGQGFNPVVDRLRHHSDQEQNLRNNVDNGATIMDPPLAYATGDRNFGRNPNIVGTGYTNSVTPAPISTELYAIDANQDVLVELPMPNNGQLFTVGRLKFDTDDNVGFDIPGRDDSRAYATLTAPGSSQSRLFRVDLDSGKAKSLGRVGNPRPLVTMAVRDRDGDGDSDRNGDDGR
ncbi:MAG: DUF4394 domain-containing protein [Fibrella sp.]|nr:DUF4394 domain-containing protein [Armatimonadota bacterium]